MVNQSLFIIVHAVSWNDTTNDRRNYNYRKQGEKIIYSYLQKSVRDEQNT